MSEHSSFHEYVRSNRFSDTTAHGDMQKVLDGLKTRSAITNLVVIHPPYPESKFAEEEVFDEYRRVHKKANATGYGCGKTDYLTLLEQEAKDQHKLNIVSLLNNRDSLTDADNFYTGVFLEELYKLDRSLFRSIRHRIADFGSTVLIRLQQFALLINSAAISFLALIAYVLTLLGFDAVKFFVDPQNQQILVDITDWIQQNQNGLFLSAVIGSILWAFYAWGAMQKDEKTTSRWKELTEQLSKLDRVAEQKEKLANDQDQILKRFAKRKKPLLLLVDDLDVIDTDSFGKLMSLYQQAKDSQKYSLLMVFGYNPWNHALYYNDRQAIRQELDPNRIREQGWQSICLPVPTLDDLKTWLWGYYKHQSASDILTFLEREFVEIQENPTLALAFFVRLDRERNHQIHFRQNINHDDVAEAFRRFLNRDRRAIKDIVQTITQHEAGEGAIEMLKYILAFNNSRVRVDHVKLILLKTTGYKNFDAYERILVSEGLNLLQKDFVSGSYYVYVFRQPYLRSLLCTGWEEWQNNSSWYHNEVFLGIHGLTKIQDDPELALEAKPSRLAVDVLRREGDYYYKYYGSSDAGYALRYYGLKRGGALDKWLRLLNDAVQNHENVWKLIHWRGDARRNPRRHWSREADNPLVFAPDIIVTAGRLYWMNGEWEIAEIIWKNHWQRIRQELNQHTPPTSELVQQVKDADATIQAALAEMLYQVGQPGHWDQAKEICTTVCSRNSSESSEGSKSHKASLTLTLIEHYRRIGVGNQLQPYRFLRPDVSLNKLESVSSEMLDTDVDRLRALHVMAESLWQMIWNASEPLPTQIKFSSVEPLEIDQDLWNRFTSIYRVQRQSLEKLIEFRNKQRHRRLPGGRIEDGDLLFWEAMVWFMAARYFCVEAIQQFAKWPLLKTETTRKMTQRFRSYYAVAISMSDYSIGNLPIRMKLPEFAAKMYELEKIHNKWPLTKEDERSLRQDERNMLRTMQHQARVIVEELYEIGWSEIVAEANNRLRMAETVYRRLGHQQRIASTRHARAVISHQFSTSVKYGERPSWIDEFDNYFRYHGNQLGNHLEAMRAHIIVAQWAENHDLYLSVQNYLSADKWAPPEHLGLPIAYSGEINFRIGNLIGNMEASPFSYEFAFEVFDKASQGLDEIPRDSKYIQQEHLLHRKINIHWWFAELYMREASMEQNPVEKERLLERVIKETKYVIDGSKGQADYSTSENLARLVRGRAFAAKDLAYEGFIETQKTLDYFLAQGDTYNQMQSLNGLLTIALFQATNEKRWEKYLKQCHDEYLPLLYKIAEDYLKRLATLKVTARLVLHRATHTLGEIFFRSNNYPESLKWLNNSFDILTSLRLYGTAILLDTKLRRAYELAKDSNGLDAHKKRIINAAQQIDPIREKVPWARISAILRQYTTLAFAESEYIKTKKLCLEQAYKALNIAEPEIESAINLLEKAQGYMDEDNPEDIDLDILAILQTAYYRQGMAVKAQTIGQSLDQIQSIIQARDFYNLAQYYKSTGGDHLWALRVASRVEVINEYSKKALAELQQEDATIAEAHTELEDATAEEADSTQLELLLKSISEFSDEDCYSLLRLLEKNLRNFIVEEMSKLTPRWWRQRIPPDVRTNAQLRKQEREKPYPGRVQQDLPVWEYLDFSDYEKIIIMAINWNEIFQSVFVRQDAFTVKMSEIRIHRNDIAHMRELPVQDREAFVINARSLLRALLDARMTATETQTADADMEEV